MSDDETLAAYDARTAEYDTLTAGDEVEPELLRFTERLPENGDVLDLGCGPGGAAAYMAAQGWQVDAVDASAGMVELARSRYALNARQASFDDLENIGVYDGVWANFSLLHAPTADFPRHLRTIHSSLKTGGIFHIGMKLGEGERRDSLGRYYAYYSRELLLSHLTQAGFEPFDTSTGEARGLAGDVEPWITVLSRRVLRNAV